MRFGKLYYFVIKNQLNINSVLKRLLRFFLLLPILYEEVLNNSKGFTTAV